MHNRKPIEVLVPWLCSGNGATQMRTTTAASHKLPTEMISRRLRHRRRGFEFAAERKRTLVGVDDEVSGVVGNGRPGIPVNAAGVDGTRRGDSAITSF